MRSPQPPELASSDGYAFGLFEKAFGVNTCYIKYNIQCRIFFQVNVDGLSLVWSPNSLLAAAALLEPALYGEYPETNIDVILGPDNTKPEEQSVLLTGEKPQENKPTEERPVSVMNTAYFLNILFNY